MFVCFPSPGRQGPCGRSDEFNPNLFFNLQKLLKSLSVSGNHLELKKKEWGRVERKIKPNVFQSSSFVLLITPHLVIKCILNIFSPRSCRCPSGRLFHHIFTSHRLNLSPPHTPFHQYSGAVTETRPPVVRSLSDNTSRTVKSV